MNVRMSISNIETVDCNKISVETQRKLIDISSNPFNQAITEATSGIIININELPGGKKCETGMDDLDEVLKEVKADGCDWVFFKR